VLATPMHLHAGQCIAALDAGLHALSEVTAAGSLGECVPRCSPPPAVRHGTEECTCSPRTTVTVDKTF
jgi:hypothetical protein